MSLPEAIATSTASKASGASPKPGAKFRGMSKNTFYLHLKECEFRYNYRNQNLCLNILKILRTRPLF